MVVSLGSMVIVNLRYGLKYFSLGGSDDDAEMLSPRTLLEKSADAGLTHEMVGFAAQRLMELVVESLTGVARGEKPLTAVIQEAYIQCISTCSVDELFKATGHYRVSKKPTLGLSGNKRAIWRIGVE